MLADKIAKALPLVWFAPNISASYRRQLIRGKVQEILDEQVNAKELDDNKT